MRHSLFSCITLAIASTAWAGAETFWLDGSSSMNVDFNFSTITSGTLIGDFDEESNPDGTKTMPGVFGSEGNQPIPLSLDQVLAGGGQTDPTGSFTLQVDTSIGLISVADLNVNVLGGDTRLQVPVDSTIYMLFETFRTYSPESLFVGGFELPIPLGSGAITGWTIEQDGIAGGALTETGTPGEWTFFVIATLNVAIDAVVEDQPIEVPSAPVEVQLTGTYVETSTERIVTLSFDESSGNSQVFDPPFELPETPLPLPTVLPPGGTANVVLSLALSEVGSSVLQSGTLRGSRDVETVLPGDANGDGQVNVDDLLIVISSWGPCQGCTADFNLDGMVGVDDLLTLLANWGA